MLLLLCFCDSIEQTEIRYYFNIINWGHLLPEIPFHQLFFLSPHHQFF